MAIDGLIAEKSRIMEELLRLTAHMHQALSANDSEKFESFLESRGKAFEKLMSCDSQLKGIATPHDDLWMRQLKMIESSDAEIVQFINKSKEGLISEEFKSRKSKEDALTEALMQPRGNTIQVRG